MKIKLEYVWLDGYSPQKLRSKTKVHDNIESMSPNDFPIWSFDGSSTNQSDSGPGNNTDCLLRPVYVRMDPIRGGKNKIILCEVLNPDGTPHITNTRSLLSKHLEEMNVNEDLLEHNKKNWFGWEQEYTLTHKPKFKYENGEGIPLGFEPENSPRPQGDYYCGIGSDSVVGREIVEEHLDMCIEMGLDISGINAEVMLGQWEYQIGPVSTLNGSDQLWMSRYILYRVAEKHDVNVSFYPKLIEGDWNGSGCHVNFSTPEMRKSGGIEVIENSMIKLRDRHNEHISVYGIDNYKRMTGLHETSNINKFTYGYSTRDTSVRIPAQSKIDGRGYFEDRRPASNCDPYLVSKIMIETINSEYLVEA